MLVSEHCIPELVFRAHCHARGTQEESLSRRDQSVDNEEMLDAMHWPVEHFTSDILTPPGHMCIVPVKLSAWAPDFIERIVCLPSPLSSSLEE